MANKENLISIKDFAEQSEVSTQYIYKLLKGSLKPYKRKVEGKIYIDLSKFDLSGVANFKTPDKQGISSDGLQLNSSEFATKMQKSVASPTKNFENIQLEKPVENTENKPNTIDLQTLVDKQKNQFATEHQLDKLQQEFIKELQENIKELKRDKENLLKDKEHLINENLKWQQLFADERNKVKLLEQPKAEVIELNTEPKAEVKQTFMDKLKNFFNNS